MKHDRDSMSNESDLLASVLRSDDTESVLRLGRATIQRVLAQDVTVGNLSPPRGGLRRGRLA